MAMNNVDACDQHDGDLDPYGFCQVSFTTENLHLVVLQHSNGSPFLLAASQFLSLMQWGEQNRERLEQLAKEVSGEY